MSTLPLWKDRRTWLKMLGKPKEIRQIYIQKVVLNKEQGFTQSSTHPVKAAQHALMVGFVSMFRSSGGRGELWT